MLLDLVLSTHDLINVDIILHQEKATPPELIAVVNHVLENVGVKTIHYR